MNQYRYYKGTFFAFFLLLLVACSQTSTTDKGKSDSTTDLAKTKYEKVTVQDFPFTFEKSENANIKLYNEKKKKYWFDLVYPQLKANVYFSYKTIDNNNLYSLLQETRAMAYKHKVKADAIYEKTYINRDKKLWGITYEITGNSASNMQFILTDSSKHFVRAALYFDTTPNIDSLAPMVQLVEKDIKHLIETFEWKNSKK